MTVRMQVMLDRELIDDLKRMAAMRNQSFSSLVRQMIREGVKEEMEKVKAKKKTHKNYASANPSVTKS